ncbi:hypothetical protein EVAR_44015_1 [Eumeta japonica]|uniref:Uncharacterized protein n=1 Tax=Eumeta variegata TaxID=151549 RepID=A0A4C1XGG9_EUMVA|nr:hypothetical protein EVAR_44015_1 [Eumeta japonica]
MIVIWVCLFGRRQQRLCLRITDLRCRRALCRRTTRDVRVTRDVGYFKINSLKLLKETRKRSIIVRPMSASEHIVSITNVVTTAVGGARPRRAGAARHSGPTGWINNTVQTTKIVELFQTLSSTRRPHSRPHRRRRRDHCWLAAF